jgi:hypothetical protein
LEVQETGARGEIYPDGSDDAEGSLMTDDGKVELRWFAIPNARKDCGWLPMVTNNGHNEGCDTYSHHGYSKEQAESLALERAQKARDQYLGDWDITIVFGEAS